MPNHLDDLRLCVCFLAEERLDAVQAADLAAVLQALL